MRAIAGMARSYKGRRSGGTVGASLLANRIPRRLRRWAVREQARSYEQPTLQVKPWHQPERNGCLDTGSLVTRDAEYREGDVPCRSGPCPRSRTKSAPTRDPGL